MSTTQKVLRAGAYGRQSKGSERSVERQITECTRDAREQGYDLVGTYEDLTSASRHARKKTRPDHTRLLADLNAGKIDVVVVWETSRADRKLTTWSQLLDTCRDLGVLIRVTDDDETYDVRKPKHWKRLAEDGVSNAYASEETRQRVLSDVQLHAERGGVNGPVPYGYIRVYDPVKRTKSGNPVLIEQASVPAEAAIVEEIFRRVAAGEPVKVLADELAARDDAPVPGKWRTKTPGRWAPNAVRDIVRNVAYIGKRRHQPRSGGVAQIYDSKIIPTLVDEELFWKANRVMDERAVRYWRPARAQHVLTGVPVCAVCGGVYAGSDSARYGGRRYGCRAGGCGYVDAADLEEYVLAYVLGRLAQPDVYGQLRRAGDDADAEVAAARAEAEKLRARLEEWRQSARRGETTPATMAVIERDLTADIQAAERKAERAGISPAVRDLVDAGNKMPERWNEMPLATQRDVIGELVDVVIVRGRRGVRLPIAERVTITWRASASDPSTVL